MTTAANRLPTESHPPQVGNASAELDVQQGPQ